MNYFPFVETLSVDPAEQLLRFSIHEGDVANEFLRQGPVAAHMLLSSGHAPRLIVAFPAGNSAAGLWFEPVASACAWAPVDDMRPVRAPDHAGRTLYGIEARLALRCDEVTVRTALLSSTRVLRDYQGTGRIPPAVIHQREHAAGRLCWWRDRADGAAGYALALRVEAGTLEADADGALRLRAGADGVLRVSVTALSGEPPLTPVALPQLLRVPQAGDARTRDTLSFLTYQEKWLAGSWRFNTYFGRDTLMTLALLMPALTPQASAPSSRAWAVWVRSRTRKTSANAPCSTMARIPPVRPCMTTRWWTTTSCCCRSCPCTWRTGATPTPRRSSTGRAQRARRTGRS